MHLIFHRSTEYAKEAFELSKMQESTRQIETQKQLKEMEGQIEQLKIEQTRLGHILKITTASRNIFC